MLEVPLVGEDHREVMAIRHSDDFGVAN